MRPSPYLDSLKVASQKICKSIDASVGTILITYPDYKERSNRGSHDSIRDLILRVLAFSRPSAQFSGASSFPWAMASSVIWQVEFPLLSSTTWPANSSAPRASQASSCRGSTSCAMFVLSPTWDQRASGAGRLRQAAHQRGCLPAKWRVPRDASQEAVTSQDVFSASLVLAQLGQDFRTVGM